MKKLTVTVLAVMMAALCLCSCAKGGSAGISLYDLKNAMVGATDKFGDMKYASSADEGAESIFKNITEMSYAKVEGFFVYYAVDGTGNADELAVIEVKSKNDLPLAKAALEAHLEKRKALYATYDKTQLTKLEGGRVVTNGRTAALIVADDTEAIVSAYYSFFK